MAEYIERNAAIGALRRRIGPNTSPAQKNMLQLAAIDIRGIKAADVAPVVRGRWIISCDGYYPYCSKCKAEPKSGYMTNYCHNCGAKMDGGVD